MEGGGGEIAHHRAIARRHLAEIFGADNTAGALHVLDDDAGLAVDQPADVTQEYPRLGIGPPTGRIIDQHGEPLAGIERLVRDGLGGSTGQHGSSGGENNTSIAQGCGRHVILRRDAIWAGS